MKKVSVETSKHEPDQDEISDAVSFMSSCHPSDLVSSWSRISCEWDIDSVISVHRELCENGTINTLIESFKKVG